MSNKRAQRQRSSRKATTHRKSAVGRVRTVHGESAGLPTLVLPGGDSFDRIVAVAKALDSDDADNRLVQWFVEGLRKLPLARRKGSAVLQFGIPAEGDMWLFEEHLLRGAGGSVALLTGATALVLDFASRATRDGAHGIRAARQFEHRMNAWDVAAIIRGRNLMIAHEGPLFEHAGSLARCSWNVWAVLDEEFDEARGRDAAESLRKLPERVSSVCVRPTQSHGPEAQPIDLPSFSECPEAQDDSVWTYILLQRISGSVSAEWVALFHSSDPGDEEAEVRAWYFRLFEDFGPWIFVPDGSGEPTRIETPFTADMFHGMPAFYALEKSPVTRVGSSWRLLTPDGASIGTYSVRRISCLAGREMNQLQRLLLRSKEFLEGLRALGEPLQHWVFRTP